MTLKYLHFLLIISIPFLMTACGSVYKKHYDNGYTFFKHKRKAGQPTALKKIEIQQQSIDFIHKGIKKEKDIAQKSATKNYQTYHKAINKIENNAPARLLSSINSISLKKINALKLDTIYRKSPPKSDINANVIKKKSEASLVFAIISIIIFWFLFLISLVPAIIALVMVKKAEALAKLNGDTLPSTANAARIIAWVTIGLNILAVFILILYLLLLLVILGGI